MVSDRRAATRADLRADGRLVAATAILTVLALLAGLALRQVMLAPPAGALCVLVARPGWISLLGFPAGWVLVPMTGALLAALVGSWVARRHYQAERSRRRWWAFSTMAFVVLYVPFGPLVFGLLPPECFIP